MKCPRHFHILYFAIFLTLKQVEKMDWYTAGSSEPHWEKVFHQLWWFLLLPQWKHSLEHYIGWDWLEEMKGGQAKVDLQEKVFSVSSITPDSRGGWIWE